jgi:hypothetical protein
MHILKIEAGGSLFCGSAPENTLGKMAVGRVHLTATKAEVGVRGSYPDDLAFTAHFEFTIYGSRKEPFWRLQSHRQGNIFGRRLS